MNNFHKKGQTRITAVPGEEGKVKGTRSSIREYNVETRET